MPLAKVEELKKELPAEQIENNDLSSSVAFKPGQKYCTPTPGYPDRVYYESLYRQKPDSELGQEYVLNYGILSIKESEELMLKMGRLPFPTSSQGIEQKPKTQGTERRRKKAPPGKVPANKRRNKLPAKKVVYEAEEDGESESENELNSDSEDEDYN